MSAFAGAPTRPALAARKVRKRPRPGGSPAGKRAQHKPKPTKPAPAKRAPDPQLSPAARAIYAAVRAIPRGRVATYGQIAELAGIPSGHRVVARAMRTSPDGLPWQRVVGKKDARRARINLYDSEHAGLQRALLEREGVRFDPSGCIPLARYGWLPG